MKAIHNKILNFNIGTQEGTLTLLFQCTISFPPLIYPEK
jgi:hypothetical protein